MTDIQFQKWPSIARLSRDMIITEKIDGTNAAVLIVPLKDLPEEAWEGKPLLTSTGHALFAQSRTRFIHPTEDNFGFAQWVYDNAENLAKSLGPGRHFGEWWGSGIQRGYGLTKGEKRFSLFNVSRYGDIDFEAYGLLNVDTVPVLAEGVFDTDTVKSVMYRLEQHGSKASPGFMNPEGIIVFHTASNTLFKKTLKDDEVPKTVAEQRNAKRGLI